MKLVIEYDVLANPRNKDLQSFLRSLANSLEEFNDDDGTDTVFKGEKAGIFCEIRDEEHQFHGAIKARLLFVDEPFDGKQHMRPEDVGVDVIYNAEGESDERPATTS